MKKISALFLSLTLVFLCLPICVFAEDEIIGEWDLVEKIDETYPALDEIENLKNDAYGDEPVSDTEDETLSFAEKNGRLIDSASLLDTYEASSLRTEIDELIKECSADFVIVTTNDTGIYSAEEYADDFYDYGGYGVGSDKCGSLLLINMGSREFHITTTGAMIGKLQGDIDTILSEVGKCLSNGDYYGACNTYLDLVSTVIINGGLPAEPRSFTAVDYLWRIGVGLVIGLIIALFQKKKMKNVAPAHGARIYLNDGVRVLDKKERLYNSTVSRVERSTSSSGSGSHTGSSGTSHGGGGGRF